MQGSSEHAPSDAPAIDLQAQRQTLMQRAAELGREIRLVDGEREATPTATLSDTPMDNGDIGEQLSRDAVRSAEADRDAAELRDIDAALVRMDDGSYGACIDCGEDIASARLLAQPAALRCIACQERFEQAGGGAVRAAPMP